MKGNDTYLYTIMCCGSEIDIYSDRDSCCTNGCRSTFHATGDPIGSRPTDGLLVPGKPWHASLPKESIPDLMAALSESVSDCSKAVRWGIRFGGNYQPWLDLQADIYGLVNDLAIA